LADTGWRDVQAGHALKVQFLDDDAFVFQSAVDRGLEAESSAARPQTEHVQELLPQNAAAASALRQRLGAVEEPLTEAVGFGGEVFFNHDIAGRGLVGCWADAGMTRRVSSSQYSPTSTAGESGSWVPFLLLQSSPKSELYKMVATERDEPNQNQENHTVVIVDSTDFAARLPLLITGVTGVAGYNAFFYFQERYPGQVVGTRPHRTPGLQGPGIVALDAEDASGMQALFLQHGFPLSAQLRRQLCAEVVRTQPPDGPHPERPQCRGGR